MKIATGFLLAFLLLIPGIASSMGKDFSTKTGTIEGATLTYLAKTPFAPPGGYVFSLKEFGSNVNFYMTVGEAVKSGIMSKEIADSIKVHDPDNVGRMLGLGPAFPGGFTQYVIQQDPNANGLRVQLQHENKYIGKGKKPQYHVISIKKIKQPENNDEEDQ